MPRLGVNIDHVATLREARKGIEPEPVMAALLAQASGADSIVVHLREDRRHIKDSDVFNLRNILHTRLNLEMSAADEIVDIACKVVPDQATLVPEKRQELTTEGGLDVANNFNKLNKAIKKLKDHNIEVSLFIDPDKKQISAAKKIGASMIEIHTGRFADATSKNEEDKYFKEIKLSTVFARKIGLSVNAGHGLNYHNVSRIAKITGIEELNIGHSIICRSVFVGLGRAVEEMKALI
ncbi:MAG: pyridoxine 5'-phosphate synthase [Candidatus Omnitrophica bacterium]|nr:pyridoxine 5'-phosphate synthase [Candidatus Omnitrophota bacterium]